MARKRYKTTEQRIEKLIKAGRGQGDGPGYQPWLQIGDFSSVGRGHRILDHRTGRIHHLFSDLEARYYYILAWSDNVLDIREQYPLLPRTKTEEIAAAFGYKHPRSPGETCNEVMTTDFLLTVRGSDGDSVPHLEARYVKYAKDMTKKRVCEKLEIERAFWAAQGVPFKIVTENSISEVKAKNIERVLGYYKASSLDITKDDLAECSMVLLDALTKNPYQPLSECTDYVDRILGLDMGGALSLFYHLSAHKLIPLCIDEKLLPTQPVRQLVNMHELEIRINQKERAIYELNPA